MNTLSFCRNMLPFLSLLAGLFFSAPTRAQGPLTAEIRTDQAGGCVPFQAALSVSTNASKAASYQWDLGNGNTSLEKTVNAVYLQTGSYTVRLTITDGSQVISRSRILTVYTKPQFELTADPLNGCLPMPVTFTATRKTGDGAIVDWHWDFGDGQTSHTSVAVTSHVYGFKQLASVSLTAVSEYGCSNTVVQKDLVRVGPAVTPAFQADRVFLCSPGGSIRFTNHSTGAGTLTWLWNFGDGTTSTEQHPTHVYAGKGAYSVRLTVTSSEGCTQSLLRTAYINVDNFITDFREPAALCVDRDLVFQRTGSPLPISSRWFVDGVETSGGDASQLRIRFPVAGDHRIRLLNSFGTCIQDTTHLVRIRNNPRIDSFQTDYPVLCSGSNTIRFRDVSPDAVKWSWNFNYYSYYPDDVHASTREASYNYNYDATYPATLKIEDAYGCQSSILQYVKVETPQVRVYLEDYSNASGGCLPFRVAFRSETNRAIAAYRWDFGDGSISTEANPVHTYTTAGQFMAVLTWTTVDGCSGNSNGVGITVSSPVVADFNVASTVCGNTPVTFRGTANGGGYYYYWLFHDTPYPVVSWNSNAIQHKYEEAGTFDVGLILINGACRDTVNKTAVITVKPPFPKIANYSLTCEGDRGKVTFSDASREAESWKWWFSDGAGEAYTSPRTEITHVFKTSGWHDVVLSTVNGACTVKDSIRVPVLLKQSPVLSLSQYEACAGQRVDWFVKGLTFNPSPDSYSYNHYGIAAVELEDGTQLDGVSTTAYWYTDGQGSLYLSKPGLLKFRMIIRSSGFHCLDTTNWIEVRVKGIVPALQVVTSPLCHKNPVEFRDVSEPSNTTIRSWTWDFGDGQSAISTNGDPVSHQYGATGYYNVNLTLASSDGCVTQAAVFNTRTIRVSGPTASFTVAPSMTVAPGSTVQFTNTSQYSYAWVVDNRWNFGDGQVSNDFHGSNVYTNPGTYGVTLITRDDYYGCPDTARVTIMVAGPPVLPPPPTVTGFRSQSGFIGDGGACPPVKVNFAFSSNQPYTRLHWDFGDGFTLQDQLSPAHIFTSAGEFIVTLTVFNGATVRDVFRDTVRTMRPDAIIAATDLSLCIGETSTLHAPVRMNGYAYHWDYGNGRVLSSSDSLTTASYSSPGSYIPTLVVRNAAGCAAADQLKEPIIVHPNPRINILPGDPVRCKDAGVLLAATGATSYQWSPAVGLSEADIPAPLAMPADDQAYTVTGTDAFGCDGSAATLVRVPKPFSLAAISDASICQGEHVQLVAAGAVRYSWILETAGLNSVSVPDPIASPQASAIYTVVGHDAFNCYTDTATARVIVRPSPTAELGADLQTTVGTAVQLLPVLSTDVTQFSWTPAEFLSCSNCAMPFSKPYQTTRYQLQVANRYGCTAADSVLVTAVCLQGPIHIANAFTPNRDGNNERFGINTPGISRIHFLKIFDRWGNLVFEHRNYYPGDNRGEWDGRYRGAYSPAGTYVYFAELECGAGERFEKKGTVTLIR